MRRHVRELSQLHSSHRARLLGATQGSQYQVAWDRLRAGSSSSLATAVMRVAEVLDRRAARDRRVARQEGPA